MHACLSTGVVAVSMVAVVLARAERTPATGAQPPLRSIESLASPLDPPETSAVLVRGVVTLVRKRVIYVQDQTGALAVFPPEAVRLAIGDEVEIQGDYRRAPFPAIHGALIRRLWSGSPPVPLSLKPEQAAEGSFRSRLIDTEGRLLQKSVRDGYLRLTLEGDRQAFGASLELSSPVNGSTGLASGIEEGSTVRLVGVCSPSASPEEAGGSAFLVLLRSTDDIRTISPAPWWNLRHAMWVGCAAVVLLTLVYRSRSRAQKMQFRAIVEERSRMAREMHDTLAQGFSGLTYQLEGLARELDAPGGERPADRHLAMALDLVRHCREEAHRSIFALRSLAQTDPDLLGLLVSSCDSLRMGRDVRLVAASEGKPVPVADEVLNHLLRIGQEALANALRHSGASEVSVTVRYAADGITLEIADNGAGFDSEHVQAEDSGHFGLTGMRERARQIHAALEVRTRPGEGTRIRVRVAGPARRRSWLDAAPGLGGFRRARSHDKILGS